MMKYKRDCFRIKSLVCLLTAYSALTFGHTAEAEMITVLNHGFEDTSGGNIFNEFSFGTPADWELYDPSNVTDGGAGPTYFVGTLEPGLMADPTLLFTDGAPEGERMGLAFNFSSSGGEGEYGYFQTLAATLQANTIYTLTVEIGNIGTGNVFNFDGFPGYRVDLLAGGTVIAPDINSIGSAQDNNSLGGLIPEAEFATSTVTFQTGATHAQLNQALGIRLVNLNVIDTTNATTESAELEVDFDNVQLFAESAVPEPSGLILALTAILGVCCYSRKRLFC
ncbi:hypothetical protein OAF98_05495 [Planctomicrobium sp.]|nr:hypothetical protein [Planctomicrobium sp.]MDB4743922.1 hypothetical protein [Planctomicrobium sp.]